MEFIANTTEFNALRNAIFKVVDDELGHNFLSKIQPLIGVWNNHLEFSKQKKTFNISDTGVLSVPFECQSKTILRFSLFMFLGEMRLGVLVDNEMHFNAIKQNCNGLVANKTPITKKVGDAFIVDWIFRDEWIADTRLMYEVMGARNAIGLGAIADALSKQSTHIVISCISAIMEAERDKANY